MKNTIKITTLLILLCSFLSVSAQFTSEDLNTYRKLGVKQGYKKAMEETGIAAPQLQIDQAYERGLEEGKAIVDGDAHEAGKDEGYELGKKAGYAIAKDELNTISEAQLKASYDDGYEDGTKSADMDKLQMNKARLAETKESFDAGFERGFGLGLESGKTSTVNAIKDGSMPVDGPVTLKDLDNRITDLEKENEALRIKLMKLGVNPEDVTSR